MLRSFIFFVVVFCICNVSQAQNYYYYPIQQQVVYTQPNIDPTSFLNWLNAQRAMYGLGSVGLDNNLSAWAQQNNIAQNARGLGHFIMGPARRQNSAWGSFTTTSLGSIWMNSAAHRSALLDPTITWIGIAGSGAYITFNAY